MARANVSGPRLLARSHNHQVLSQGDAGLGKKVGKKLFESAGTAPPPTRYETEKFTLKKWVPKWPNGQNKTIRLHFSWEHMDPK
jgi:hypothetical protein